jgi:ubiquinone/menaquinone biosynthesis C-methylase UbiE
LAEEDKKLKKLHLECGKNILEDWINLNSKDREGVDVVYDVNNAKTEPMPFKDNSIDEFFGRHVLERVPDLLSLMSELHRVSKPNAKAVFHMPYGSSDNAWEDPVNCRAFFINSFGYFTQPFYWINDYSYLGDWQPETLFLKIDKAKYQEMAPADVFKELMERRNVVIQMTAVLKSIKPIREAKAELQAPPKIEFVLSEDQFPKEKEKAT